MNKLVVPASICAAALALLVGQPGQARADLIVNGGFEDPVLTLGELRLFSPGQTIGSAGWTVLGDGGTSVFLVQAEYSESFPDAHFSQANPHSGLNSLDITGPGNTGPSAGVRQVVATAAGQEYTLSFYVGRLTNDDGPGGVLVTPATVDLSINGGARMSFTNADITLDDINWMLFSQTFTAVGSDTTIDFFNNTPAGTHFAGLDDVSLTAIPEPSALAMMALAAVGLLAVAWHRRTSTLATVADAYQVVTASGGIAFPAFPAPGGSIASCHS